MEDWHERMRDVSMMRKTVGRNIRTGIVLGAGLVFLLGTVANPAIAQDQTDEQVPIVANVVVEGNSRISKERILSNITTHPGRPLNKEAVRQDVRRLFATNLFYDVKAEETETPNGTVITYRVWELPKIQSVEYIGNTVFDDKKLMEITALQPGKSMEPGLNRAMARRIESEYRKKGYPFASVELVEGGKRGDSRVIMHITEGPKTKVKKIQIEGNTFVSSARLKTIVGSRAQILGLGGKYDEDKVNEDIRKLVEYYKQFGYIDVRVGRKLEWTEDRSGVRLTFVIDEGDRYKVRNVEFAGNKVFKEDELTDELKLTSGEFLQQGFLERDLQTLRDTYGKQGYIHTLVNADVQFLEEPGAVDIRYELREDLPKKVGKIKVVGNEITDNRVILQYMEINPGDTANTEALRLSEQMLRQTQLFLYDPGQGIAPTVQWDPENDPTAEFQDVLVTVQEAQTGSLLFGVGVNSDSGVGGSLVLHERNFDITRVPRSVSELMSGHAFRGKGQELRIEAVPGTQVNRYSVTFREPRFFGTKWGFSTSGYYFRRIFPGYDEERGGGRFSLTRRFSRTVQGAITYRIENVGISDPAYPIPADLAAVLGDNFLTSVQGSIIHDTRDSFMRPGSGHRIELAYEQGFGDFTFPKVTAEASQYWTLHSRADGSGKHTLTARGHIGYSGDETPMFERFYAGGFQTLRGFQFRGVGPVDNDIEIGGNFMLLAGMEYQFPLTADDNLGWVFFVDSGTVESDVEINHWRVAPGFGIRVQVPQLGPVPLAFDFAFPVADKDTDDRQVFSFSLGFFR